MAVKCAGDGLDLRNQWFMLLSQASKTCLASIPGIKRIHYKMQDEREMLEDWKITEGKARELVGRYWRRKSIVGNHLAWDLEIGDSAQMMTESHRNHQFDQNTQQPIMIRENNSNPLVVSRSLAACFEWRIRNLPPPGENYLVSVEAEVYNIIISSVNKKYYKKLTVPDLKRLRLQLLPENLLTSFANRTLVIQYKKPIEIIELEKKIWQEIIQPLKAEGNKTLTSYSQAL